jgi:hypothetical protein
MADMVVELSGEQFKKQYLLYIIHLYHNNDNYYYIGQTGDRNVKTARPVFRRLAAHLGDRQSTENQVYQFIAHDILNIPVVQGKTEGFSEQSRDKISQFLVNSKIKMFAYSLEPFSPDVSNQKHKITTKKTEVIENQVICLFHKSHRIIMNKKWTPTDPSVNCPYPMILEEVIKDFELS